MKENPFVKITDNAYFEKGKKSRTALVKGRTELQGQQKEINSKVNALKTSVKEETERLIAISQPAEEKQQVEVKAYESKQDDERLERERIKEAKEKEIKGMIDEICNGFSGEIAGLEFKEIELFTTHFYADLKRIDTSSFEELEMYYSGKVAVLKNELSAKTSELEKEEELRKANAENKYLKFLNKWSNKVTSMTFDTMNDINTLKNCVTMLETESLN